jgi:hypothetical protein
LLQLPPPLLLLRRLGNLYSRISLMIVRPIDVVVVEVLVMTEIDLLLMDSAPSLALAYL